MKLVKEIYKLVEAFPKEEKYGLSSQICRASVSVPSNIAEGASRKGINDFKNVEKLFIIFARRIV